MPVVLEGSTDYWIDDEGFEDDPYVDYPVSYTHLDVYKRQA